MKIIHENPNAGQQDISVRQQAFGYIIFSVMFLLARIYYFFCVRCVLILGDSFEYLQPVISFRQGLLPNSQARVPGYSIFLFLAGYNSNGFLQVIVIQHLLTWFASVFLCSVIFRYYRSFFRYAVLVLSLYAVSADRMFYDSAILVESVYTNLVIILTGVMIITAKKMQTYLFSVISLLLGLMAAVRVGIQLYIFLFAVLLIFCLYQKKKFLFFAAAAPFLAIFILLLLYNSAAAGKIQTDNMAMIVLRPGISLIAEQDETLPPEINLKIKSAAELVDDEDRQIIENSWNLYKVYNAVQKNIYNKYIEADSNNTWKIIKKTIIKKPLVFIKMYITAAMAHNFSIIKPHDLYGDWIPKVTSIYRYNISPEIRKAFDMESITAGWDAFNSGPVNCLQPLRMFHISACRLYVLLFQNFLWVLMPGVMLLELSVDLLKRRKFSSESALIGFFLLFIIFKSLLVGIGMHPETRYGFPVYVLYYTAFILITVKNRQSINKFFNKIRSFFPAVKI
ncbi:MAG: hypothetical protein A2096_02750 [Spirochaetes bacterium GWF1_41_5]|nr:MAG: hypothetical protein A2096_02750 [Spirochaetes bacterium GWF1_41_5]